MTVRETEITVLKRQYPHVDNVEDWRAQQSLRLLWDRIFALEERLQATEATQGDLVSHANAQEDQLTRVDRKADETLALVQGSLAEREKLGAEHAPLPGGGDGGEGARGCGDAGSNGHLSPSPTTLNAYDAGRIVCGTGAEYSSLLAATPGDQAARDANAEELVRRMIWHLQQEGYSAGRQQNPSGAISKDKLTVVVDGTPRAYDVFVGKNNPAAAMTTAMQEVAPVHMVTDSGIAD